MPYTAGVECQVGLTHTGTDGRGAKWVRKDVVLTDPASTAMIALKMWGDEWATFEAINRSVIMHACHVATYKNCLELNSSDETTLEVIKRV